VGLVYKAFAQLANAVPSMIAIISTDKIVKSGIFLNIIIAITSRDNPVASAIPANPHIPYFLESNSLLCVKNVAAMNAAQKIIE